MTDLWSLTIAFRVPNFSLRLTYNSGDNARAAYELLKIPQQHPEEAERGLSPPVYFPTVEITDSYGTTATIDRDQVMTHWVTHMGSEAEGVKAVNILNAHAQASLQRQLSTDPMLKGVIQPQKFNLNG